MLVVVVVAVNFGVVVVDLRRLHLSAVSTVLHINTSSVLHSVPLLNCGDRTETNELHFYRTDVIKYFLLEIKCEKRSST